MYKKMVWPTGYTCAHWIRRRELLMRAEGDVTDPEADELFERCPGSLRCHFQIDSFATEETTVRGRSKALSKALHQSIDDNYLINKTR